MEDKCWTKHPGGGSRSGRNYFLRDTYPILFRRFPQDRHRAWIDLVAEMFGGLDLCSLEALVARDGTEVIIEVNDCAMGLLGESQEEDRRNIAEVRIIDESPIQTTLKDFSV